MDKIIFEDIILYAFHGHLPEEQKIGNRFCINLAIYLDLKQAGISDKIADTFDYRVAYEIVREEMIIPSELLEHIASRVIERLFKESEKIFSIDIRISKMNPPFGGDVKAVSVELTRKRE